MRKILIFGNSGSGKSTLAKELCDKEDLSHLDLDILAWQATSPPQRQPIAESAKAIQGFIHSEKSWVIEGCYTDLLECAAPFANEVVFMDLPVEACIANARKRPWEPHKYESKEAQDDNLENLISWIAQYNRRVDTFSEQPHRRFYDNFQGIKMTYTSNQSS
jgi:adenylate kinase family enzyme